LDGETKNDRTVTNECADRRTGFMVIDKQFRIFPFESRLTLAVNFIPIDSKSRNSLAFLALKERENLGIRMKFEIGIAHLQSPVRCRDRAGDLLWTLRSDLSQRQYKAAELITAEPAPPARVFCC